MTPASAAAPVPVYNKHINETADGNTGDTTMQQAIYNNITTSNGIQTTETSRTGNTSAPQAAGLLRWVARK